MSRLLYKPKFLSSLADMSFGLVLLTLTSTADFEVGAAFIASGWRLLIILRSISIGTLPKRFFSSLIDISVLSLCFLTVDVLSTFCCLDRFASDDEVGLVSLTLVTGFDDVTDDCFDSFLRSSSTWSVSFLFFDSLVLDGSDGPTLEITFVTAGVIFEAAEVLLTTKDGSTPNAFSSFSLILYLPGFLSCFEDVDPFALIDDDDDDDDDGFSCLVLLLLLDLIVTVGFDSDIF